MGRLLNLGCGSHVCRDSRWVNVDLDYCADGVHVCDLRKGIPFPDASFDAVYHSHLLEHLCAEEVIGLVLECHRILKPAGIIRVAVPDLEEICRLYLDCLEKADGGDETATQRYHWMMLEMLDQITRTQPGGGMAAYLKSKEAKDSEFIISRAGDVAKSFLGNPPIPEKKDASPFFGRRLFNKLVRESRAFSRQLRALALTPRERAALKLGMFRWGGEIHQLMYDRYSLRQLLLGCGFSAVRQCTAVESGIADWNSFLLDVDSCGTEHAPSSLYMEGIKSDRRSSVSDENLAV